MLTELFVEGLPLDMTEDISALLTFQLDDIRDFGSRNTTFSKTIVLPGTQNNNRVFGHIFELQSANPYDDALPNAGINFNAAKSARAILFQANIQVFKGVVRLLEIVIDGGRKEYEVAVFGEMGGLVADLGNKKLEDLDFSAYNIEWNETNIVASWDNTPGSGVFFPLIDYGTLSTNKHDWDFRAMRPALYAKEYIDKIFEATGYTLECPLFNTARFKTFVVPHNQQKLRGLISRVITASINSSYYPLNTTIGNNTSSVLWDNILAGAFSYSAGVFTYTDAPTLSTTVSFHLAGMRQSNAVGSFSISVRKNGVAVATQTFTTPPGNVPVPYVWTPSVPITLATNDTLDVYYDYISGTDLKVSLDTSAYLNVDTDSQAFAPVAYGQLITINDAIPKNILQKDFLSGLVKLFNLYIYEDRFDERKIIISPYVDFYDADPSTFVDWTYKLNRDKPVRIKPMSELNSRYYEFKFKPDNDYYSEQYRKRYNQGYGDYIYDSEYEFVTESQKVEVVFSSAVLVGYAGEEKVYPTIFKRTGTTSLVEESIDSNIRLLQTKKVTGVANWDIKDGSTVLDTVDVYGYAGHLDDPDAPSNDLNFGAPKELFFTLAGGGLNVQQFNVYWSPYMAEITDKDSRLLTGYFYLTARDIYNLDFSKFRYVDSVLYRISRIDDYNATREDECKVTLLKVINTLY